MLSEMKMSFCLCLAVDCISNGLIKKNKNFSAFVARLQLCLLSGLTAAGLGSQSLANAQDIHAKQAISQRDAFTTTAAYVVQFYPLWFTYYQSKIANTNRIAGPDRISPIYHIVVAINDDTLYGSSFLDLMAQPMILKVPATTAAYSVLTLDPFGDIFESGIPSQPPGTSLLATTYALTGPGFAGVLPAGVTPIPMPLDFSELIFRADKFSPSGEDQIAQASQFRAGLFTQPLCAYLNQPCPAGVPAGGTALIVPEIATAAPFKTAADALIAKDPITFLKQLQTAVAAPNTPPLSPAEQALSDHFDSLFGDGNNFNGNAKKNEFIAGAQAAHDLILENYLTHTGTTNWIHFTNIGAWGDHVIDRASITEFIQYGNGISTAAYYHTFRDGRGFPLDGSNPHGYVLTFPNGGQPEASRFWSVTAYTPDSIELIDNPANKYVVASYTPGLQTNTDGSLSIYMTRTLPDGVPPANWLPIPRRSFNIMLRVYGVVPSSTVADDTYVPPGIDKIR